MSDGVLPADWALPALTPTNEAWFTSGALAIQQCASCDALQHPPEEVCSACGSMTFTSRVLAPTGTVASYTVAHHAVHPALEGSLPYTVVVVSLGEAPHLRVVGNLLDAGEGGVTIGLPVVATWQERVAEDGTVIRLPQWRRALGSS